MRNTGSVTGSEVTFKTKDELVSATDTKGVITFVNDHFCRVSKYEREELIGQAHNLVRHPDMPAAVFDSLWTTIRQGKPWLGAVKNRCKNGDYYWVSAYVTPALSNGTVVGYESVRRKPEPQVISRAENCYKRINEGKSAIPSILLWRQRLEQYLFFVALLLPVGLLINTFTSTFSPLNLLIVAIVSAVAAIPIWGVSNMKLRRMAKKAQQVIDDPLATYIYTGRVDAEGIVAFTQLAQKQHLSTALGRFGESAKEVRHKAEQVQEQSQRTHQHMVKQQEQTISMTSAIEQMSQAVQEVAENASATFDVTRQTVGQLCEGDKVLQGANGVINNMSEHISDLSQVVEQLKTDGDKISSVVDVIRGIAEQTNLLALNAAIEAARAGEQGRGFAVVADEVRTLAQRTQESTQDIQEIIEALGKATDSAAHKMQSCLTMAGRSVEEVSNVGTALSEITLAVNKIDSLSQQIAASAEEQSQAAVEINNNTKAISEAAKDTSNESALAAEVGNKLNRLAQAQFELIERFQ